MANSEDVDLMNLGQHCSVKSCRKLDYLPFKCTKCGEVFCVDHRGEREHSCPNTDLGDTRAVVCPLCNKVIVRSRHQPLNDQVERHILSGCKDLVAVEPKERKRANRCTYKNCRRRELLPFVCPQCERVYCLGHRHALDHECRGAAMAVPRTVAVH